MSRDTTDALAADTADAFAADTRDVLAADTTDVLAAHAPPCYCCRDRVAFGDPGMQALET